MTYLDAALRLAAAFLPARPMLRWFGDLGIFWPFVAWGLEHRAFTQN